MRHRVLWSVAPFVLPVVIVALWWAATALAPSPYFPAPPAIVARFVRVWFVDGGVTAYLVPSLVRFLAGFLLAIVLGVVLGFLIGLSPRARRDLQPILEFFRATPVAGLLPLAIVLLGSGWQMEIALIVFASVWPILVSTTDSVRGGDPVMVETARVYGLSGAQRVRRIVLPAALPRVFSGMRIAIALAIVVVVFANMFGQSPGIGYFVVRAQQSFDIVGTWAGMVMIGIVGAVVTLAFVGVQHRVLAWHRGWRAATATSSEGTN